MIKRATAEYGIEAPAAEAAFQEKLNKQVLHQQEKLFWKGFTRIVKKCLLAN